MGNLDLTALLEMLLAFLTQWGLRALGALAVLVAGRWAAGRVRRALTQGLEKGGMEPMLIPFTASVTFWGIMVFVAVAVLGLFGVPTASFVAVLGAAGLAVGLALQGTLANFAAGVVILTFRPFVVDQTVEIAGTVGTVTEVGLFSTSLNTPDNIRVTIPNSQISDQTIKNYSANESRRIDLVVGVAYSDDLDIARRTIERVLASSERVLAEPAPVVAIGSLGDSSVNFFVRPWVAAEEFFDVKFELTHRIKIELESAGCSIPFPQRDVHLHQVA